MVGLLSFVLTFVYVLTSNMLCCRALQVSEDGGFRVLSVKDYSEKIYRKHLAHRKDVFQCDFDQDLCGFIVPNADFFWTSLYRGTPSAMTGPSGDITGQGLYVFIETSSPRKKGDKALLATPVLPGMIYCLQFGLHAYGNEIGGLFVYMEDNTKDKRELLFKLNKNYGNKWQYVIATIVNVDDFQIVFEGVRGKGYKGDLAMDDIRITTGKCPETITTDKCGLGYAGISSKLTDFPPFLAWPWLVGLTSSWATRVVCSAVYVTHNCLLTSKYCAEKFSGLIITTYPGSKEQARRFVVKVQEYPSKAFEGVLLHLRKTPAEGEINRVCLPPSMDRVAQNNCYLIATLFSTKGNAFEESPVTIVSLEKCGVPLGFQGRQNLLCIETTSHYGGNDSRYHNQYDGYIVCQNKMLNLWVLHAIGSFFQTNNKTLIFTKISTVVDWIDAKSNKSMAVPKLYPTPVLPQEPTKGIQIFEKTRQKCLTYVPKTKRFSYQTCNVYKTSQRFLVNLKRQLISLATNRCLGASQSGRPNFVLRVEDCGTQRKSQRWTCVGKTLLNDFYKKRFINFGDKGLVRLSKELEKRAYFVIYKTKESICSALKTVKGEVICDINTHSLCGFSIDDAAYAKYKWAAEKPEPNRLFKIVWRGTSGYSSTAEMRSPMFNDQRCLKFQSYLFGHPRDKLIVYRDGEKGRRELLRISPGANYHWRNHEITITPQQCDPYEIFFFFAMGTTGRAKFLMRGLKLLIGSCEPPPKKFIMSSPPKRTNTTTDNHCLKGWTFLNGSCYYLYDLETTWYQASTVCQITGADLASDTAVTALLRPGTSSWFGVKSCANGDLQTMKAMAYPDNSIPHANGECLQIQKGKHGRPMLRPTSCHVNTPFVCQRDPQRTKDGCGFRNRSQTIDSQWPWHVVLVMFKRCICAGTLIAPGYVVTSSLCVTRIQLKSLKIFIPSSRTIIHNVTKIIIHPKSNEHDIAIIMFKHSFLSSPLVRFACVNKMKSHWKERKSSKSFRLLNGSTCYVLGWGTYIGGKGVCGPRNYRVHEVEIIDKKMCGQFFGDDMMKEGLICARPRQTTWRYCLGDTGGPLVCDIAGAWTLVGITRWGAGCVTTRDIGIYTDVASTMPWLETFS